MLFYQFNYILHNLGKYNLVTEIGKHIFVVVLPFLYEIGKHIDDRGSKSIIMTNNYHYVEWVVSHGKWNVLVWCIVVTIAKFFFLDCYNSKVYHQEYGFFYYYFQLQFFSSRNSEII